MTYCDVYRLEFKKLTRCVMLVTIFSNDGFAQQVFLSRYIYLCLLGFGELNVGRSKLLNKFNMI